jgi:hypothetical protein
MDGCTPILTKDDINYKKFATEYEQYAYYIEKAKFYIKGSPLVIPNCKCDGLTDLSSDDEDLPSFHRVYECSNTYFRCK